jgi:lysophospholipase L1-like esterase
MVGESQAPGFRVVGLLLVVLAACLFASPAAAGAMEVSLGDSYSSGEGAGSYDFWTKAVFGNGCHRSHLAWPRLLGVPERAHLACSGATTDDFFAPQKSGLLAHDDGASQLERLRELAASTPVSRVFVTIGGNDLGFKSIILACVIPGRSCLSRMDRAELARLHGVVFPKVVGALLGVTQADGSAEVVLVGYPDVIPAAGEPVVGCGWLGEEEKPRIRLLEGELDSSLAAAAAAAGVTYVSIRDALDHHELCTRDRWINSINPLKKPVVQENGHPNEAGQRAMARSISGQLGESNVTAIARTLAAAVIGLLRVGMVASCWPWG